MSNKGIKDFLIARIRQFLEYEMELTPDEYFTEVMKYVEEREAERLKWKCQPYFQVKQQKTEDFAKLVLSQAKEFNPMAYYDQEHKLFEVIKSPDSFYGEFLTHWLTVYKTHDTNKIVGCLIDGVDL